MSETGANSVQVTLATSRHLVLLDHSGVDYKGR
ncbi:protein of unknown function [Candidatus Hydrogenisulfobacillus filiaventi]|uniref:Uncharacterized protein n=1 Tax=Candidatus Hydrogenisulfobacillus filiaventi TaxID=2707344 RepID=A0A6F8ZH86_9FIRM|nr:protein of unknown function [Candidatus Hydrogenisulfobacillus filiaventi]